MLNLGILLVVAAFINALLIPLVQPGSGWIGSPLGMVGSRLVYSRSEVPWHNGVEEDFSSKFIAFPSSSIPGYFDAIYAATKPKADIAHQPNSTMEELAKDLVVVKLMRISLDWDPTNYGTAYDLSFLLAGPIRRKDLSLDILNQTLSNNLPLQGRLLLLVQEYQILYHDRETRPDASKLVAEIIHLTQVCSQMPPTPELKGLLATAEAIPKIEEREKEPVLHENKPQPH